MGTCPDCGTENPSGAKFCLECARPLSVEPSARETRKTVTIVFADIAGSTQLGERHDPEVLRGVLRRHFAVMREVLERHGGTVEKFIGDAVMAVFGIPTLHEDDALRAVRAAAELRHRLDQMNTQATAAQGMTITVRTGVNTGEVVAGDPGAGETLVTGDAVNVAARLEQAAAPGEILLGSDTYRLVRDAVEAEATDPLAMKGKADSVSAYRLTKIDPTAAGRARRLDASLVGRERELARLQQTYATMAAERSCQLFTLLGPAGIGKSRLVHEFVQDARAAGARVLRGRCLPYGEGITYWPVAEVIRSAAGMTDADHADAARAKVAGLLAGQPDADVLVLKVATAIGLSDQPAPQEEIFWAIRRVFEHLAQEGPLVVVFDDIQWAEPTFLDLIEYVVDWSASAPTLLLCIARPELLEARAGWGGGKPNAATMLLEPLAGEAAEALLDNLLATPHALPTGLRSRIVEAADGNPLFVEEMVAMLIDDGALRRDDGHWSFSGDSDGTLVPSSIRALLASRIDRLPDGERAVAERAAVVGKVFERAAVVELCPPGERGELMSHLLGLVRKELLRPERTAMSAGDAFRFRHLLLRDAAYAALPKQERAELHERFADWLERTSAERLAEVEEIVGYHLEQAHLYRVELGDRPHAEQLGERSVAHLAAGARRTLDRGDVTAGAGLLRRALALMADDAPRRPELLLELGDALDIAGRLGDAEGALDEAIRLAVRLGDEQGEWRARCRIETVRMSAPPPGWADDAHRTSEEALTVLGRLHDDYGLALAWWLARDVALARGAITAADLASARAATHFEAAGRRRDHLAAVAAANDGGYEGARPAADAIGDVRAALALMADSPAAQARVLKYMAGILAIAGEIGEARDAIARSVTLERELGRVQKEAMALEWAGQIELIVGNPTDAEAPLRASAAIWETMGERYSLSTVTAELSRTLALLGKADEALGLSARAEELTGEDDVLSQALWRQARALALTQLGRSDDALTLAREAVDLLVPTDFLWLQADAWLDLAHVLRDAGDLDEGRACAEAASKRYRLKGHVLGEERAEQFLAELGL
jgi:class 3 adenylate cyclase/tetratricopeptide (TPR) repeat protein